MDPDDFPDSDVDELERKLQDDNIVTNGTKANIVLTYYDYCKQKLLTPQFFDEISTNPEIKRNYGV